MPPVSKIPNPRYVIERRSRARSAVTAALEGYRAESDSLGAATVIIGVLGPEEKNHLLRLLTDEGDGGVRQQADVALHLAKDPTPSVKKAVASACVAVVRFRAKSNQLLGTSIGPRLWRTASGQGRLKKLGRPSVVNNRKVCQTVRDYLLQHSSYTAKRIKVAGKIVQVHNLKRSRRALWTSSAQMQKLLCLRAWYTHLGKHQSHFKKLKCRSDVCTFCHKYDKVFLPSLRTLLSQSESKMIAHQPDYWKAIQVYWNSLKLQGKTDPDDQCSLQYVRAAIKYMRRMLAARAALPVPDVAGALGARLDFHKDEADAMAALAKANVILECCEHHFSGVKRQHGFREDKVDNLEHHCVDIQLDFMENMTTPLGPEEAQDWFWATARQSITTLGFYAHYWLNGVEHHQYFHFISDILNHDSAFAVQAFGDLLLRLGLSDQHTVLHVFADCGPHFRSYEFLWCLVEVCKSKFPTVFLHFLLEHHGKGRNDGQFGLQRRWAVDYARDHVISDVSDMKGALEAGAMMTMSLDPPPAGPSYHIVVFTPAAKPKFVDKLDNSKTDLQIEYTYCLRIQRHPVPMYVAVIKDFVYSDRSTDEQKGVSIGNVVMKRQPAKEESWRVSYRKTEPEKDNLNVGVLQRRLDHQKHAKLANLASRADPEIVKLARDQRRAGEGLDWLHIRNERYECKVPVGTRPNSEVEVSADHCIQALSRLVADRPWARAGVRVLDIGCFDLDLLADHAATDLGGFRFDFLTSHYCFCHLKDALGALCVAFELLRPGGILLFIEPQHVATGSLPYTEHNRYHWLSSDGSTEVVQLHRHLLPHWKEQGVQVFSSCQCSAPFDHVLALRRGSGNVRLSLPRELRPGSAAAWGGDV
ncbi:unnamed protein product, partial [Polarella glacialis]